MESGVGLAGVDWVEHWRSLVRTRAGAAGHQADPSYWDRRATSFARMTGTRADPFLDVVAPYVSPRKTLLDVGAGAGRHAVPLAERLEWVTAVEPSEGMRARIPHRENMTVIASTWEDAEAAPADLVICCHVMHGVDEPVPFVEKMERCARERVFIMLRESSMAHPGAVIRERLEGGPAPSAPRFSDLLLLLIQMGIAPDVDFLRYPMVHRYADMDEAVADAHSFIGLGWDESTGRMMLEDLLRRDGAELVYDSGDTLSGVAHWQPRAR